MALPNTPAPTPAIGDSPPILRPLLTALLVVLLFFGGLGTWAALAPLESAAVAPGQVTVAGHRRTIQHFEGGIIDQLLVEEGDRVEQGQVLITLDETQTRARLDLLQGQFNTLLSSQTRLIAERDQSDRLEFPPVLRDAATPDVDKLLRGEIALFDARRTAMESRIDILHKRVDQLKKEIASLNAQVISSATQLALIEEEREAVETLVNKGVMPKPRLLELKRAAARLLGEKDQNKGLIARAEQRIGEAELQILDLRNQRMNEVVSDLRDVQAKLVDVAERLKAARDVLSRTEIRAPLAGVVVGLSVHTHGGVIAPGQELLDIVPEDDSLVVEAHINPIDIDVVHSDLRAQVRLTAFKQRTTPTLEGTLVRVSADSFSNEQTGQSYYLARVTISAEEKSKLNGAQLYPGMPAEVIIVTGKQTTFEYILAPLRDSFRRAFREK